ncbi:MAG: hypothetical protein QM500_20060 [Methylococcales bacterium]
MKYIIFLFFILFFLSSCTTTPKNTHNICKVFQEKDDWYADAKTSYERWGLPIHINMAIMYQESHFVADAKPPRPKLLGFIPWFRSSSAYGYAQAQDGTWNDYLNNAGDWGADRDDFADATDFIGWYCSISHKKLGIPLLATKNLYLAYHEGHGGYIRKTYLKKRWLINTSSKVAKMAQQYKTQLLRCKDELESNSWFFW